jgi:hypothetical protein
LKEGRAILEGADCGLAAKEVGRRAFHKLKAVAVGVVEGEDNASMVFAYEVFLTSKPTRFCEDASACADSVLHEFGAENGRRDGVSIGVPDDRHPAKNDLAVALGRGCAAVGAKRAEEDVIIFGDGVKGGSPFQFEDKVLLNLLGRPTARKDLDVSGFGDEVVLNAVN